MRNELNEGNGHDTHKTFWKRGVYCPFVFGGILEFTGSNIGRAIEHEGVLYFMYLVLFKKRKKH